MKIQPKLKFLQKTLFLVCLSSAGIVFFSIYDEGYLIIDNKVTKTIVKPTINKNKNKKNENESEDDINLTPLLKADKVLVKKSERRLFLLNKNKVFRKFHIALGLKPKGHKLRSGDFKTPEGTYTLDWRNDKSIAYKSIHISYPNKKDIDQAKKNKVSAGSNIMIHGILNKFSNDAKKLQSRDWTDGCIAVMNENMDDIWNSVDNGTTIEILP